MNIPINYLDYCGKIMLYSKINKDILNFKAVFSDETENFREPVNPCAKDSVKIKIRTAKGNVDKIFVVLDNQKLEMSIYKTEGIFDYYICILPPCNETKRYYFEIVKDDIMYNYTKIGFVSDVNNSILFSVVRDFHVPEWSKGAVIYQIYVDRFYNGDKTNDVVTNEYIYLGKPVQFVEDWNKNPDVEDIRNFYGGDLQGVIDKLPYLQELGVEAIYFNPIFVSPSNHKYDIQDYDYIDPHIGVIEEDGGSPLVFEKFNNRHATKYVQRTTEKSNLEASNKLFIRLVEQAHKCGIKIILDGVFNHCGAFNKWLDKEGFYALSGKYPTGAYRAEDSKYNKYFRWYDRDNWPNNDCYDSWWGFDNHPKLNYEESPDLYNYIMEVGKKWVSPPYNADGWRLDVAADLGYSQEFNHKFWKDFRKSVREGNPDAIILAEHYGDPSSWLQGDEWDTIMNYDAFMEPISWFLTGMEKHSEAFNGDLLCNGRIFQDALKWNMAKFSCQSLQSTMNELSNHDHSRFLTRTNMKVGRLHTVGFEAANTDINKGIMKEAIVFQMTWPGAPTIYYGDEVGLCGWTDPDNRRSFPWGKEDKELFEFHKTMIKIHKKYNTLKKGSVEFLYNDYGIVSYSRFDKENKIVVILNNNSKEKRMVIPVWNCGVELKSKLKSILFSGNDSFDTKERHFNVINGMLEISMPAYSSMVLVEE